MKFSKLSIIKLSPSILIGFLALTIAFTSVASAAGLVPCGDIVNGKVETQCTWPDLIQMFYNIVKFLIQDIALPLGVIFIIVGGVQIMFAGASPEQFKKGKETITAALIGIAITLGAWLIISLILQAVCGSSSFTFLPWNTIKC